MPATTSRQRQPNVSTSPPPNSAVHHRKKTKPAYPITSQDFDTDTDDDDFSDEDSDGDAQAIAFQMDGQDGWTQNYCGTCDCLIAPGQGVNARKAGEHATYSPTSSISKGSQSGLKSKAGTIKGKATSPDTSSLTAPGAVKRTYSAGRLHASGGNGSNIGPSKRTGSAAGRLNALSDLKPTTKLHDTNKGKSSEKNSTRKSTGMSRQNSTASSRSGSEPSSPKSPANSLPRSKKGGMLGSLTPAALKQKEDLEASKSHLPGAMYCSEECRAIDEQKSNSIGELAQYMQQPASPTNLWSNASVGSYGSRSHRTSVGSMSSRAMQPAAFGQITPELDCQCQECMEKNSIGTVPSGASDTTDGSLGYPFGSRVGFKQRTKSGRIITPQNLVPPGNQWTTDYFGPVIGQSQRTSSRPGNVDTDSSTKSDESNASELWEPSVQAQWAHSIARDIDSSGENQPPSRIAHGTRETSSSGHVGDGLYDVLSSSQASTTSPLRLLRDGNHRGSASVDVTSEVATSPQPYSSSFLSRSVTSEQTEGGASSGVTLAPQSSLFERRQRVRNLGVSASDSDRHERFTDSPAPFETGNSSTAMHHLKSATRPRPNRDGESVSPNPTDAYRASAAPPSSNGSSHQGWLRNSLSSAWNTLRGNASTDSGIESLSRLKLFQQTEAPTTPGDVPNNSLFAPEVISQEPTPKQSLVHRPTIKRGDVPAFAREIGHGAIPGEGSAQLEQPPTPGLSKSLASTHEEEERRRRRAERDRAHRHQRSRDVTQLPPLLGVAHHASSTNLHGMRPSRALSNASIASGASQGSSTTGAEPLRPTTPSLRKSPHSASGTSLHDLGTSPGRVSSMGSFGTSPRRAGLGWGAMVPMAPLSSAEPNQANKHIHQHVVHRPSHHHGHHSIHGIHAPHHRALHHSHSRSSGKSIPLGNIGMLGMHPHGHGPVYGRHATTPVRMSTPSVPEDGGEMTGAALKGEQDENSSEEASQIQSRSYNRRTLHVPPSRPRSGMASRSNVEASHGPLRPPSRSQTPSNTHASTEEGRRQKMYPVLDVPNRQPTHDHYGLGWGRTGIDDLLPKKTPSQREEEQHAPSAPSSTRDNTKGDDNLARKKLFYFDTS